MVLTQYSVFNQSEMNTHMKVIYGYCLVGCIFTCAIINFTRMVYLAIKNMKLESKKKAAMTANAIQEKKKRKWMREYNKHERYAEGLVKKWEERDLEKRR